MIISFLVPGFSFQDEIVSDDDELLMASMSMNDANHSTPNSVSRNRNRLRTKILAHGSYSYASLEPSPVQQQHRSATSESLAAMSTQERLEIRSWGLPQPVERAYEKVCSNKSIISSGEG